MREYRLAATGGTFDIIHRGHMALLSRAFEVSEKVIIGLTSDELAEKKSKSPENDYKRRLAQLLGTLFAEFPDSDFQISRLDDDFGPAVLEGDVEALVVSSETAGQGTRLNELRAQRGLGPVKIVTVPMLLAEDGTRISTTRIKSSEIDSEGNLV